MVSREAAKELVVGGPEVGEGRALSIGRREPLPQAPTTGHAAISDEVRYDLSGPSTGGDPEPSSVF